MSSPLPRCRESCQSLRDCRGFLFVNGTDLLPARDAETLSTPVQIYISKKELRSWSSEKKIPEDQGVDPPSICFCGIIGKRKSWTVRHLAARFLTEICLHQGYCKVQVLLFSFLFWPDRQSITSITGNETRTQHLQNITILTLDLEFKWGFIKMCFFSLAILCRFWEMWERVLTRELPQGELHFSHCIFWCSCKKRRESMKQKWHILQHHHHISHSQPSTSTWSQWRTSRWKAHSVVMIIIISGEWSLARSCPCTMRRLPKCNR